MISCSATGPCTGMTLVEWAQIGCDAFKFKLSDKSTNRRQKFHKGWKVQVPKMWKSPGIFGVQFAVLFDSDFLLLMTFSCMGCATIMTASCWHFRVAGRHGHTTHNHDCAGAACRSWWVPSCSALQPMTNLLPPASCSFQPVRASGASGVAFISTRRC